METVNIIASFCTILSFLLSLIVLNKVSKIDKSIRNTKINKKENKVKGDGNTISGRDSNITNEK